MSSRKFFSGNSLEQAVLAAARHYGIEPERVTYREIDKKHGFLRSRKRHVIQVEEPGSAGAAEEVAEKATETVAETVAEPKPEPAKEEAAETETAAEPVPERQEDPPRREPQPPSDPGWHSTHETEPAEPVREEPKEDPKEDPLTAAPGLPDVPSRWSKEPQPIGEPIAPSTESPSADAAGPPAAASPSPFVEVPTPPSPSKPESRRPEPRERRRSQPAKSKSDRGLTELPEAPRRARERLDQAAGERAEAARKAIEMLFELSAVELEAEVLQGDEGLEVEVWGTDQDLLFEDRGRLLLAYEHLLPRLIRGLTGRSIHCRVDSDSFHEIRAEQLRDLAQRVASKVHQRGRSETLEPMAPDERRIVHLTLADDPTVETQSRGRGLFKRVTVNPIRRGGDANRRGPRY